MKKVKLLLVVFVIVGIFISGSILAWFLQVKKPLNVFILDKTVPDISCTEHKSFDWVLTYNGYVNRQGKLFDYKKDYYGFFPLKDHTYNIKSLRLYEVLSVPDDLDMVYYTDTYGVMYEDWFKKDPDKNHAPLLYGRLNQNDYLLLSEMRRKNKLIVTEFNLLAPPTSILFRQKVESLFDFKWTGWIGCYINSLKAGSVYLPSWVQKLYEEKHLSKWNFTGSGIVLIHESGEMIVLESGKHLEREFPEIITTKYGQETYQVPDEQKFSAWFDIIDSGSSNQIVAKYHIYTTQEGTDLLKKEGLSNEFPAIIEHLKGYKFYYFAGDFSDRSLFMGSSHFKGVADIAKTFSFKVSGAKSTFFWRFYEPLLSNIIKKNLNP